MVSLTHSHPAQPQASAKKQEMASGMERKPLRPEWLTTRQQ